MATGFPTSLDVLTNPTSSDPLNNPNHADQHANTNDAIEALEAKVGVNGSAITTSLDYKVTTLESNYISKTIANAKGDILVASGNDVVTVLTAGTNGYHLQADNTQSSGLIWAAVPVAGEDASSVIGVSVFA